jgi:predicted DNA-binding transcriptional regulator YafY
LSGRYANLDFVSARKDLPGRLLRLLSLLQSRREWSGRELAERLGVTDRTVRRDVERLRSLDYPVTGTTGLAGGYRLAAGKNVPPLLLDDDEAVAVAVGLAGAAGSGVSGLQDSSMSALAKLEQVLPARLRPSVAAVGAAEVVARDGVPQVDAAALAVLAACCRDQEIVAFSYSGRRGASSDRRVEPHRLVTIHGQWYLLAYDPDRADWRTFRVDRISRIAPTRHHFTARELPAADAASYLLESFAAASYRHTAVLRVQLPAEVVRGSFFGTIPGTVEPATGRSKEVACVVRLSAEAPALLIQYVAGIAALGAEYTLEASPEAADLIRNVGLSLARTASDAE